MRKNLGYIRQQKDISEEKRMKKNVWIAGVTALLSAGLVWIAPVSTLADERIPDEILEEIRQNPYVQEILLIQI